MAEAEAVRLSDLLRSARARLAAAGLEDPGLESRILVEHLAGIDRLATISDPQRLVPGAIVGRVLDALQRREQGEPVYRILGVRDFHGLRLHLSPGTLDPRPDTEMLVDAMAPILRTTVGRRGACRILDLGTGTGAIALALLAQAEAATALGVDLSPDAVATARRNAEANGLGARFEARQSDWFAAVAGRYDAIVSNPPYIRSSVIGGLDVEVRDHDPHLALDGGPDGLDAYRRIAAGARDHLDDGGCVGVEIGFDQRVEVSAVFAGAGFGLVAAQRDLGGRDRVLIFRPESTK